MARRFEGKLERDSLANLERVCRGFGMHPRNPRDVTSPFPVLLQDRMKKVDGRVLDVAVGIYSRDMALNVYSGARPEVPYRPLHERALIIAQLGHEVIAGAQIPYSICYDGYYLVRDMQGTGLLVPPDGRPLFKG